MLLDCFGELFRKPIKGIDVRIRVGRKGTEQKLDAEEQAEEDLISLREGENAVHVVLPPHEFVAVEDQHLMGAVDGVSDDAEGLPAFRLRQDTSRPAIGSKVRRSDARMKMLSLPHRGHSATKFS